MGDNNQQTVNLKYEELDKDIKDLVDLSVTARQRAYCPYSNFKVGAAILATSGKMYYGCNVENASYCLTICAERTALVKAVSEGDKHVSAIAVCAEMGEEFVTPCGPCRQSIVEFCPDVDLYLVRTNLAVQKSSMQCLFPGAFSPHGAAFVNFKNGIALRRNSVNPS